MKIVKFLFLSFLAVATLAACNHKTTDNAQEGSEPTEQTKPEEPTTDEKPQDRVYQVMGFQKTSCFGKCPVYQVKFYSDGKATWNGKRFVDRMGPHEARVDAKVLKSIREKAHAVKFFDFYNEYPVENKVADLPSTITYIRIGDMEKTVRNTHESPESLLEFEKYLSEIIEGLEWEATVKE